MQFSMKERDIYQLDRELEVNEKVFVTNKQGIDYTVSRKDNLYYVYSCSNGHTENLMIFLKWKNTLNLSSQTINKTLKSK